MPTDASFFSGKPTTTTTPPTVRVRTILKPRLVSSTPLTSPLTSPEPSPVPAKKPPNPKKRKAPAPVRVKKKKLKKKNSWDSDSDEVNDDLEVPSAPPIYRSSASTSRSTSSIPTTRRKWVTSDKGDARDGHVSSESVVVSLMKSYKAYFHNPDDPNDTSFEPHPTNYPVCDLEYPNTDAVERFVLLQPKDKDHYSPIMDFEASLYTIVKYYMTPEQQSLFGPIPGDNNLLPDNEDDGPPSSVSPSPPNSNASLSPLTSISSDEEDIKPPPRSSPCPSTTTSTTSDADPEPEEEEDPNAPLPTTPPSPPLLRTLKRAIHTCNGPLFMKIVRRINIFLKKLKYPPVPHDPYLFSSTPPPSASETGPNALMQNIHALCASAQGKAGIPEKLLMRVIEENYQRSVGPHVNKLRSSTVYGELLPPLVSTLLTTHCPALYTSPKATFLDLGSGVGNICVQASLQTGCFSYGIEIQRNPSEVGNKMLGAWGNRVRMWGLQTGDVELEEGDFLGSKRVDELMGKADVVLVDNKVFEGKLNESLRPKFLDLKEGAVVISLAPFVPSVNARVTERNLDDISAIFRVSSHPYFPGSVSWGNAGGMYYVHEVDREGYRDVRERYLGSGSGAGSGEEGGVGEGRTRRSSRRR
ncbi:Nucleosomal histone H3-Lys79 methylase [Paramarasmius palmivorus]|uniref:Histone-lysine N-methyltransferase, H3 lysine-79 specific n=1 Tax=Paramarasmius palmivorus TaxID=297713 RepID=A0AAW0CUJ5_9AGAR